MNLKWNRVSTLLAFLMGLAIIGIFVSGQLYFLNPIKEQANRVEKLVEKQTNLKTNYPPEKSLLTDYRKDYEETWSFLPEGEQVNQELVVLEKLAAKEKVSVQQIIRVGEPLAIEGLDERYMKTVYDVELTSTTMESIQNLVKEIEALERIWNIHYFGFEKLDEGSFTGTFTFELFYHVSPSDLSD